MWSWPQVCGCLEYVELKTEKSVFAHRLYLLYLQLFNPAVIKQLQKKTDVNPLSFLWSMRQTLHYTNVQCLFEKFESVLIAVKLELNGQRIFKTDTSTDIWWNWPFFFFLRNTKFKYLIYLDISESLLR